MVENIKNEINICEEKKSSSVTENERKLSVADFIKEIEKLNFKTDKCLTIEEMNEGVARAFANWKEENSA